MGVFLLGSVALGEEDGEEHHGEGEEEDEDVHVDPDEARTRLGLAPLLVGIT